MDHRGFIEIQSPWQSGRLEYHWIEGDPDQPTFILLHEGLGCVDLWKHFPKKLLEKTGWGVFSYSRFGYGRSDRCALPRTVDYMHREAEHLSVLLEQLNLEKVILLGHSDGASIISIYAGSDVVREGRNALLPRVSGLVLLAPHFFVEDVSLDGIRTARHLFETTDLRQRLEKYHGEQVDDAFWGWNDVWLNPLFRNWTICDFLDGITMPVLCLQGNQDEYGTIRQLEVLREQTRGPVVIRVYEDCGHSPQTEREQTVISDISEFVMDIE
ncbi:MAG: alpha/beta fold hydrolase [Gammaproteobacteria bacterium]|nr:alpha/beta fold hydrolase [Gammaproteobacteria bacterium]